MTKEIAPYLFFFFLILACVKYKSLTFRHFSAYIITKNCSTNMTTNVPELIKEKVDYIYQRLRTQISNLGSSTASQPHVFYVFGASVC